MLFKKIAMENPFVFLMITFEGDKVVDTVEGVDENQLFINVNQMFACLAAIKMQLARCQFFKLLNGFKREIAKGADHRDALLDFLKLFFGSIFFLFDFQHFITHFDAEGNIMSDLLVIKWVVANNLYCMGKLVSTV